MSHRQRILQLYPPHAAFWKLKKKKKKERKKNEKGKNMAQFLYVKVMFHSTPLPIAVSRLYAFLDTLRNTG